MREWDEWDGVQSDFFFNIKNLGDIKVLEVGQGGTNDFLCSPD